MQLSSYAQTTLFPFGSTWKYLDDGSNQNTAWRTTGFNDASWLSGPGQLGFGDGDEATILSNGYVGYYFRKTINIPDASIYTSFQFDMYRDDGVVIYVNGTEVFRDNMPAGTINYNTLASSAASDDGASIISTTLTLAASQLISGNNVIAVEVHQNSAGSSDVSWDMRLTGLPIGFTSITLGPYLQKATPNSIIVRWYTDIAVDSEVKYGTTQGSLSQVVTNLVTTTNHSVTLTGLSPYTKYYYSVGTSSGVIQSGADNYFLTLPGPTDKGKYTFWVTGDVGDLDPSNQKSVLDRYNAYIGNNITNGWLLLGDNAYNDGQEAAYTTKFFQVYQESIMKKTPLWPATGNHEYNDNTILARSHAVAYFDYFDPPQAAEAGGFPSASEAYYSFNYGNIHFVALDTYIIEPDGSGDHRLFDDNQQSLQVKWLKKDLAANTKEWTIVYFHHAPYTKGSHNSDNPSEYGLVKMRENIMPILEQYDVDLVLSGHSHSYERGKLMKGHFGYENSFVPLTHNLSQSSGKYNGTPDSCPYVKDSPTSLGGTVYAVAGSGGQRENPINASDFPHDALPYGIYTIRGSLILDIEENRLDAKWLDANGTIWDQFTIMKNVNKVDNISLNEGQSVTLDASWVGQYNWSSGQTSQSITITPASSGTYTVKDPNQCITDTFTINVASLATIDVPAVGFTETCAGSTVNILYTISGTFTGGNIFTLQLSDAAGSFASPVSLGTVSSTTAGTINGTIPTNTVFGSNYRVRVVSSNPVVIGTQSANFTVNTQSAPVVGTITQPTCSLATGSVVLSGLPASGTWTLTRTPGGITTTGTGATATITGLATDTYTYTVTNDVTCVSSSSANVVINAQPITPIAPTVGTITQPTCSVATGSVVLSGLPSSGTWTLTRTPGGITTTGTGANTTITGLAADTYTYTVTNAAPCVSSSSANVVINTQPATPTAPTVGIITQPTCTVPTGSVVLNGLPSGSWTINLGAITGSGSTTTITALAVATTYNFSVTETATGCTSSLSADIIINSVPVTGAPTIGTITQPTCTVPTGSVALNGLPSGSWTINPGAIAGSGTTTTITGLAVATTFNYSVTETATGCTSALSADIIINSLPVTAAPTVGTITQPTCIVSTGSVVLNGLPSGSWTINPGAIAGSGTTTTITGLAVATTYNYLVTEIATGCTSVLSADIIINSVPVTAAPTVGTITQPTCPVPTGSVVLNGLPLGSWTISPGAIVGSGTTTTLTGLNESTTYNFTVTETSTGCTSALSANIIINSLPVTAAPTVGTITQPTCPVPTGSVVLNGLPLGSWTISPGAIVGSGTTTTLTGLNESTTYNFTVTETSTGCTSALSANIIINSLPVTAAPTVGTITQPTCPVPTGSVVLTGLPLGSWTISPGAISGSGSTTTLTGLAVATTYNYSVTEIATGCTSVLSADIIINSLPVTSAPTVGAITQPTCTIPTGSVVLNGLPSGSWTINPGAIVGSGITTTLTGLNESTTYNFIVTETGTGCTSVLSADIIINSLPVTSAPTVGTITQPTCIVPTGSVVLNGLPSGSWTINPGAIGGSGTTTTITGLNESATYNFTVTETSTGCISTPSSDVIFNTVPGAPAAPTASVTTQPTCSVPTGTITVTVPANGIGISYDVTGTNPVVATQTNATGIFTGLNAGEYDVTTTVDGCLSTATALTINVAPGAPTAPTIGTITQPACSVPTGSVVLNGLPSGSWTINPGSIAGSGSTTTITGLAVATTYNYSVTETATGCTSALSVDIIINSLPVTSAPTVGTITQPTCSVPTGSVVLNGLPSGSWTINPGAISGSGTTTTLTGLNESTTYNFTVTETATGCASVLSTDIIINSLPVTSAPAVGPITQPTCSVPTGSVVLNGLPSGSWTINPGAIVGSGSTTTLTGLNESTTYNFIVTETSTGCTSSLSADIIINSLPITGAPIVGTITQPTCTVPTGSVVLNGLPSGSWTINPGAITGLGTTITLTGLNESTTYNFTLTETSTGCVSAASSDVIFNAVPGAPVSPTASVTTQPTCSIPTGTITITVPANGVGISYQVTGTNPVVATQTNATGIFTGLNAGEYDVTTTVDGCLSTATALTINVAPGAPTAPTIGTITQPACSEPTGSVVLNGLPSGSWTINPGAIAGSGITFTLNALAVATTYNFSVTETVTGCTSVLSSDIIINSLPVTAAPTVGTITQPTCIVPTGSVVLNGLPSGSWTINPGAIAGSGTTTTLTGLAVATIYNYSVTETATGCTSVLSADIIINSLPITAAPIVGTITQPTCIVPTGSVVLNGLPSGSWTINPGAISGSGSTTTITGLAVATTYNYSVTETTTGCTSVLSADIIINSLPVTAAPTVGTITQPTCTVPTGSVVLNGLPSGSWTINPGAIVGSGTTTTLTGLNESTTYNFTVTETFTGCISAVSSDVIFNAVPGAPAAPTASVTTQPTCSISKGTITVTVPANGVGISYQVTGTNPIVATQTNATGIFTGLAAGEYDVTATIDGCLSTATALTINVAPGAPTAPTIGTITQPTCTVPTGSVALNGLPSGSWTINPGAIAGSGTTTTITGLAVATTFNYSVTETATGCTSALSADVIINSLPVTAAPTVGTITQPTCIVPTGSVVLNGLPSGSWTINPGAISGSGTTTTLTGLAVATTYNYSVIETATGCTSSLSADIIINSVPVTSAPTVGTITQPTCTIPTGSVALSGLPLGLWTINPGAIAGSGTTTTITGLAVATTYNYSVIETATGCTSVLSADIIINSVPVTSAPTVGTITQPTCTVPTGSVVLNGLPSGSWTINPGAIVGSGTTTTLTGLNESTTYNFTVTETSTGCVSAASSDVIFNAVPGAPASPTASVTTQPTCSIPTGTITVTVPANGVGISYQVTGTNPVVATQTNATGIFTGLAAGKYDVATAVDGCLSTATALTINVASGAPAAPTVGTITQPTCIEATGSVALSGLPSSGTWTLTRSPGGITTTGTGDGTTITGLGSGTYTYSVKDASNCISQPSFDVLIDAQPVTPVIADQNASIVTGETFTITPTGVPLGTTYTWTSPSYTGGVTGGSAESIPQSSISGSLIIPSGTGTATYTVTPTSGICNGPIFSAIVEVTYVPLPVELVNFSARVDDEKVILNWRTATELNNDYFEVQRFVNQEVIKTIGKLPGHGTTNETHDYEFIDAWPIVGIAYYRLKQVDFDRQYKFSNVIRVSYDGTRSLQLFPNPGDGIALSLGLGVDQGPYSISVMDATGRTISSSFTHTISDSSTIEMQFDTKLAPGMYFFQIKSEAGVSTRKWIVK